MELTLEMLKTVGGAVIFIELVLELFWKPISKNLSFNGWADLSNNAVAFVAGLIGVVGAGVLLGGYQPADIGQWVLTALVATAGATGAYETVKNVGVPVRARLV